jgi:hypothetical protein
MFEVGDDYFYITGTTSVGSNLSLRKIEFTTATPQWSKYMGCHEST